jgi:hypothetical protein
METALNQKEEFIDQGPYIVRYRRSGRRHELSIHFSRNPRTKQIVGLHALYDLEPGNEPVESSAADLIERLESADLRPQARCSATFICPRDRFKSVFTLPWPIYSGDTSAPFDEIGGVRVSKKAGDTILWSAIVDIVDDSLMVSPDYSVAGALSESIFLEALNRGIDISGRLLKPVEDR